MDHFQWKRGLLTALAALIVGLVAFLILFGNPLSQKIIYSEGLGQSKKFLAVWTQLEPVPKLTPFFGDFMKLSVKKLGIILLLYLWTLGFVRVYAVVGQAFANDGLKRIIGFAGIIWLAFLFFEIFAPFNLLGEPFSIVIYELFLESIICILISVTVVKLYR